MDENEIVVQEWLVAVAPDLVKTFGRYGTTQTTMRVEAKGVRVLDNGTLFLGDVTTDKAYIGDMFIAAGQWSAVQAVG